jgi:hypothetical protein
LFLYRCGWILDPPEEQLASRALVGKDFPCLAGNPDSASDIGRHFMKHDTVFPFRIAAICEPAVVAPGIVLGCLEINVSCPVLASEIEVEKTAALIDIDKTQFQGRLVQGVYAVLFFAI